RTGAFLHYRKRFPDPIRITYLVEHDDVRRMVADALHTPINQAIGEDSSSLVGGQTIAQHRCQIPPVKLLLGVLRNVIALLGVQYIIQGQRHSDTLRATVSAILPDIAPAETER